MKQCLTCRHWDAHSIDLKLGDCRSPGDHRYWRVRLADGTVAMMDSFERETTRPSFTCDAWRGGELEL